MMHRSRWLVVLVIPGMLLAGCSETTRNGEAPNGLGKARLPADARGVTALLARLPSTVAGQPRTPQQAPDLLK